MTSTEKIKVLVLGDSGVGKSCLVNLMCNQNKKTNPSWTIGCSIEVKGHEFAEGTPKQKTFFIEMWDVGGNKTHSIARHIFFTNYQAIILVHDLTNSKSRINLRKWLAEVMYANGEGHPSIHAKHSSLLGHCSSSNLPLLSSEFSEYDSEKFIDKNIPKLVIGTKLDLVDAQSLGKSRSSSIVDELGAEEILVNCFSTKSFAPGSTNSVTLSRFFDKAIEKKYRTGSGHHVFDFLERNQQTALPKQYGKQDYGNALLNNRYSHMN